ncbi:kin of IRRE-like protein 2 [Mytilus trossulus]|uniref:kin of IRRE-like protein 2 n=1 Tax=Mytilus trossulus TaxID=6551 RepID=UPI003007CD8A
MKIVIGSLFIVSLSSGLVEELAAAINVYAKIRSEAVLPCEWADSSVRWYGIGDHQYSTGTSILQGLPISLRQRLRIINDNGFNLGIRDIHKDDEGNYKCISDNGTINYNLYLIVAPSSILFPSSSDENVITADANKMFNVTCKADGGFPPPELSLMLNETLLSNSKTRTLVYAINLTRTDDFTNVTCTANHSELNHPLEIHAMFYLNLPPTQLTMMELPTLFEAKPVNISCISLGSRPQASSEWSIDGNVISNSSEDQSEINKPTETYIITSILSVEFNRLQNRKELSCRSFNLADTKGISQSRMLEIYYHPSIQITYMNTTEDEEIRKFTCKPNGNPAVYEYDEWEHFSMHNQFIRRLKGRKTDTGASEVILPVTNSFERYQDSGIYICRAQNDIADRYGNKLQNGFASFISEGNPAAASENVHSNKGRLGDDTILIVKFVSKPAPTHIFWFKIDDVGDILINSSKKYTKVITPAIIEDSFHGQLIHVDGYIISLFIRNLEVIDFSKYNCEVHNRYGNISVTVELVQTTELENMRDGEWKTAGIVLITIVGLVIVVTAALCIYNKRK